MVMARAWVSPLVNNAEPWVLGRTGAWQVIGRMSSARPSVDPLPRREESASHRLLGDLFKGLSDEAFINVRVVREMSRHRPPAVFAPRSSLFATANACVRSGTRASLMRSFSSAGTSTDVHGPFLLAHLLRRVFPASRSGASCFCARGRWPR